MQLCEGPNISVRRDALRRRRAAAMATAAADSGGGSLGAWSAAVPRIAGASVRLAHSAAGEGFACPVCELRVRAYRLHPGL